MERRNADQLAELICSRFTPLEQAELAYELQFNGSTVMTKVIARLAQSTKGHNEGIERAKRVKAL